MRADSVIVPGSAEAWSHLGAAIESALLPGTSSLHLIHVMLQNGGGRPWPKGHGRQRMPLGQKAVEDR